MPVPKHRLKASPTDILQHSMDEQGKKIETLAAQLAAQIDAQSKQIEAQGKQLEDMAKRAELQTKQIETLNADLNRLTEVLLARGVVEPSPSSPAAPAAVRPAAPAVPAAPSVVTTPPDAAAPALKPAEPAAPEPPTFAPDGTPTHLVKRGETLTTIARQHGTTVSELLRVNKIEDERKLQIGQTLLLPKPAAPAASPKPDTP
ncbi:MAG: LysM peptidoglycan-binding domain-containing protein [Chthoniobacteraceae bacterium]|nr:LysM peptidoglycan-binding domain-containing protein [Chthoniobacteraceae bacterium]